jgi:hypothetical protein
MKQVLTHFFKTSLLGFFSVLMAISYFALPGAKQMSGRGPASASLDFNQMIEESQKNSAELNAQIQKSTGLEKKILNAGKIAKENRAIPAVPEQYAAQTSTEVFNKTSVEKPSLDDKAEMKRLSRELQEVEN